MNNKLNLFGDVMPSWVRSGVVMRSKVRNLFLFGVVVSSTVKLGLAWCSFVRQGTLFLLGGVVLGMARQSPAWLSVVRFGKEIINYGYSLTRIAKNWGIVQFGAVVSGFVRLGLARKIMIIFMRRSDAGCRDVR